MVKNTIDQNIWKLDKKLSKKSNVQISGVQYSDGYSIKLNHWFDFESWRSKIWKFTLHES